MTRTSTGSAAIDASAVVRVRCENGVSLVDVLQLGPAAGPGEVSRLPGGECNAGCQRTAHGGDCRLPHAVLQVGDGAEGRPGGGHGPVRGARAPRAHQSGRHRGERRDLRAGGAVGARPERRSRGEPPPAIPQGNSCLLTQPRLRFVRTGRRQCVRRDRARRCRGRGRRRRGTGGGGLRAEIVPCSGRGGRAGGGVATHDSGLRGDAAPEQVAKPKPVFARRYGSVTAANSSPLTDGASAVLLMSDSAARALGYTPLAYVRSYAVAAVDPGWQLLQAPIFAVPKALERAGIEWKDLGLVEVHEAVASQGLSDFQGWAARGWKI